MSQDAISDVSAQQIDKVLKYLPIFERSGCRFGEWRAETGQMPHFLYSHEVTEFIHACYQQNLVIAFDWANWEEGQQYASRLDMLAEADLLTLRKLLTSHLRADRFSEGHLASVLESGHMVAILRQLRRIRDKMPR